MGATYLVYRWHDISNMPLSKVRRIGEHFGIPGAKTMTKGQLRPLILNNHQNRSTVPHPLIKVPI